MKNFRPSFVRKVDDVGYILDEIPGVIIIKGGKIFMAKTIRKPLEGFDVIFDELEKMRDALENEKKAKLEEFLAGLDAEYQEKEKRILTALENVSKEEVVEDDEEDISLKAEGENDTDEGQE